VRSATRMDTPDPRRTRRRPRQQGREVRWGYRSPYADATCAVLTITIRRATHRCDGSITHGEQCLHRIEFHSVITRIAQHQACKSEASGEVQLLARPVHRRACGDRRWCADDHVWHRCLLEPNGNRRGCSRSGMFPHCVRHDRRHNPLHRRRIHHRRIMRLDRPDWPHRSRRARRRRWRWRRGSSRSRWWSGWIRRTVDYILVLPGFGDCRSRWIRGELEQQCRDLTRH